MVKARDYNKRELTRILLKDLDSELKNIFFYARNLDKANYKSNKRKIDTLINGSLSHAAMIIKDLKWLMGNDKPLKKSFREKAQKEEIGLQGIYNYELERTEDKRLQRLFSTLIQEENQHERIVKSLK